MMMQAVLAVVLVMAASQVYAQSDDTPESDAALVEAARDAGVHPVDLAGAVNTTGLGPREYLYAVGELERPYVPTAHPVSTTGPYGLSPYLARVAWCESRYNPRAVGRRGEIGLFQLLPGGMLPVFYARGFTDPWSGEQQAEFARWAFAHGYARRWTCA